MEVFDKLLDDYAKDAEILSPTFYEKVISGLVYWTDLDLEQLDIDVEPVENGRINKTADMKKLLTKLSQLIIEDSLTGLYNRRYFNRTMQSELERHYREHRSLALAIIDIDHFKNVNDTWGHDSGDIVLKEVAKIMNNNVRQSDTLIRIGGEEFAVIMPSIRHHLVKDVMERLRIDIENSIIPLNNTNLNITVSIGATVTELNQMMTADELYKKSDQALYQAKESGRNKVVIYGSPESAALSVIEREALL